MTVRVYPNPEFDFAMGYMGGFDDVPTKQDKFKPLEYTHALIETTGNELIEIPSKKLYVLSEKKREGQLKFEEQLIQQVKENIDSSHPYQKPQELEVVIGINTSSKRQFNVDIDNLVKCILDCLNGLVYEDDSQIVSIMASKHVIKDDFIPEISGVMIGVRKLDEGRPKLNNIPIYLMEHIQSDN